MDAHSNLVFGGQAPPKLDTPYQVTLKDKKDAFHAISMMKVRSDTVTSLREKSAL